MKAYTTIFSFAVLLAACQSNTPSETPADLVNPFIGASTDVEMAGAYHGLGKTFPGATTPFGMVQVSPQTVTGGDNGPGYSREHKTIEGFSMTQMSGIGWNGDMGNITVMPTTGKMHTIAGREDGSLEGWRSYFDKESETAKAGYYSVLLTDYDIQVETSATTRCGALRFTFPEHQQSRIQIDLARRVGGTASREYIKVLNDSTLEGWLECLPEGGGWGNGEGNARYTIYYHAVLSQPMKDYGFWKADISPDEPRKLENVTSEEYQQRVAQSAIVRDTDECEGTHIGFFTEFFTSESYKPTRDLAATSQTGYATIIIGGISLGMESALTSILIVCAAVLISYYAAGGTSAIVDGNGHFLQSFNRGLYGIGIAGVGMLSTLGITLATDAYGPVADNAGGIAQMAGMDPEVRERTDALDSLGNTTAATGKGFAIGSASLTSLALLVSYVNIVQDKTDVVLNFSIINPPVLIGMFIGAMLVFVFSAVTMNGVERAAQSVVIEVRRQFREIPGILEGTATPEYAKCVSICTKGALKEMVVPAVMAVVVPIVAGLILGPTGVVGLLAGVSVAGFAVSVFMSNAGGAWDNAKKYIEEGHFGGKGSKPHKASVVGDTIGDPFKDTSGPSLNILIKLCATVSIVFSGLVALVHLL